MIYKHKNNVLELNNGTGKLYVGGKLMFKGDGYLAIKSFISRSSNDPIVKKRFQAQLNMREKPRFSKVDELEALKKQAEASRAQLELERSRKRK